MINNCRAIHASGERLPVIGLGACSALTREL